VDEIIQTLGAQHKPGDDLAGMQRFGPAVDHALLHQINHTIGKQLGVNAQVAVPGQQTQHRIRHPADPGLERRAIRDQIHNVAGDLLL